MERLKFYHHNHYEVHSTEYVTLKMIRIATFTCLSYAVLNLLYFTLIQPLEIRQVLINSAFLVIFSAAFAGAIFFRTVLAQRVYVYVVESVAIAFFVVRFFPIIGPTVWTYLFIVIIITFISEHIINFYVLSSFILCLNFYLWLQGIEYMVDNSYFGAQLVAFVSMIVVSGTVFKNNQKKNRKIDMQFESLQKLADSLEIANRSLEEEVKGHSQALIKLAASEKHFKTVVHAFPDLVFRVDVHGLLMTGEVDGKKSLIHDLTGLEGKYLHDILPNPIADECLLKIGEAIQSKVIQVYEFSLEDKKGMHHYEHRYIQVSESEVYAIMRDVTEDRERQQSVKYLSYHDHLTGLYNRRFFEEERERMDTEMNLPLSLIMLDVNGLKLANDAFGHLKGDEILKSVAHTLRSECRTSDVISRIGGDEFVIMLPRMSKQETEHLVKNIYKSISETKMELMVLSVSIGCETKTTMDQSIVDIFVRAEEFMYRKKLFESQSMHNSTITAILKSLNEKSERERRHSERVSVMSRRIAEKMELDYETAKEAEIAGLMHDIGKISIPETILNKPGKLTSDEYDEIKKHSKSGYQILRAVDRYSILAEYVLSHHERWDGKGYPRGLKENEIPLISRIIAIADAFEAMTAERTYKEPFSKDRAIEELINCAGTQFDPEIIKIVVEKCDFESHMFEDMESSKGSAARR